LQCFIHKYVLEGPEVVQRIVCFRFKKGTDEKRIQAHMDDLAGLADKIPQIRKYYGGRSISGEHGAPPDYDSLHYLHFESIEDVDTYFHHPEHKTFIERHRAIWEPGVLVLNAELD
jgi:hypothetical protein